MPPKPVPCCPHCDRSATITPHQHRYVWVHHCIGNALVYQSGHANAVQAFDAWQVWCQTQ